MHCNPAGSIKNCLRDEQLLGQGFLAELEILEYLESAAERHRLLLVPALVAVLLVEPAKARIHASVFFHIQSRMRAAVDIEQVVTKFKTRAVFGAEIVFLMMNVKPYTCPN